MRKFSLPCKTIIAISLVSMFINVSSTIVFSVLPILLSVELGVSNMGIGALDGVVEFIAMASRVFSGFVSDFVKKRKPILIASYALMVLTRPIFALASSFYHVFIARAIDRIANGLQATPRESLIGDFSRADNRGGAYGFRQSLSYAGSFLGALILQFILMGPFLSLQEIFIYSTIPTSIGILILIFFIKDRPREESNEPKANLAEFLSNSKKLFSKENLKFWSILTLGACYMLGNYSGSFAILRAKEVTGLTSAGPALMIAQNFGGLIAAFPIGNFADANRKHRDLLLAGAFMVAIGANCTFFVADSYVLIIAAAILWGIQLGISQSLFAAKVADSISLDLRGSAFGVYYLISGCTILLANLCFGYIKDISLIPGIEFIYGCIFPVLSMLVLMYQNRYKPNP